MSGAALETCDGSKGGRIAVRPVRRARYRRLKRMKTSLAEIRFR